MVRRLFIWGPPVGLMAAIFAVSSIPHLDTSSSGVSDKSLHFWAYGLLAILAIRALAGAAWAGVTTRAAVLGWTWAVVFGALDEVHQAFVPGRSLSGADLVADAFGAALGAGLVLVAARLVGPKRAV